MLIIIQNHLDGNGNASKNVMKHIFTADTSMARIDPARLDLVLESPRVPETSVVDFCILCFHAVNFIFNF